MVHMLVANLRVLDETRGNQTLMPLISLHRPSIAREARQDPAADLTGGTRRGLLRSFADMHLHRVDFGGVSSPKRGERSGFLHLLTQLEHFASTWSDADTSHVHG